MCVCCVSFGHCERCADVSLPSGVPYTPPKDVGEECFQIEPKFVFFDGLENVAAFKSSLFWVSTPSKTNMAMENPPFEDVFPT